jgi:UDP-2,3-diacylglucosamine hydrolase
MEYIGRAAAQYALPRNWDQIDFLSDLHLSAATPHTAAAVLRHLRNSPADAFFFLGDLFELWVGDDMLHLPFEQSFTQALRHAMAGRTLHLLHGNRDFLLGQAFATASGGQLLSDPMVLSAFDQRVLITHGDELCLADTAYQQFRRQVRDPVWQAAFLALPFDARQAHGRAVRHASEDRRRGSAPADSTDVDAAAAMQWLKAADSCTLLHGHTHRPGVCALGPGFERWILSDWDHEGTRTPRGDVIRWSKRGLERIPATA